MPETITQYRTAGGRVVDSLALARQLEAQEKLVAAIIATQLGTRRPRGDKEYVLHPRGTRERLRHYLADRSYRNDSDAFHPYIHLWVRLQCMDDQDREWEQPYYALNNPDAALPLHPEY
jgi:hypothetical protein